MKRLILTVMGVFVGIVMIPALFAMAMGLFGTVIGFLAEPRVMLVLLGILAVISLPGIIIGIIAKR